MNNKTILICDDTDVSIFTAIYEAYENKLNHENTEIQIGEDDNLRLFSVYQRITSNTEKAEKVIRTIKKKFGMEALQLIFQALAANDLSKGQAVYQMIVFGLKGEYREQLIDCIYNEHVSKVVMLSTTVWYELHHLYGFLRFEELENRVLYAVIHPKSRLLPFMGEHFSNRFPMENFMIYDEIHDSCLVHGSKKKWFVMDGDILRKSELPKLSEGEMEIQLLFKHFCKKIAIESRKNEALQQQMLPLRFRSDMVEFG